MKVMIPACRLTLLALSATLLSSCGLFKKKDAVATNNNGYASYPNDGGYRPYQQGSQPKYQEYTDNSSYNSSGSGYEDQRKSTSSSNSSKKKTTGSSSKSGTASKSSSTGKSGGSSGSSRSGGGSIYIVKHSDTLYGIAKKHHTTVSKIKSLNGLTSDVIRDGQKLKLP